MSINEKKRFFKWLENLNDPNIIIREDTFWTTITYKMPFTLEEIVWPKLEDLGNCRHGITISKYFNYHTNYGEAKNWITQCQKIRSNILLKRNLKNKTI